MKHLRYRQLTKAVKTLQQLNPEELALSYDNVHQDGDYSVSMIVQNQWTMFTVAYNGQEISPRLNTYREALKHIKSLRS